MSIVTKGVLIYLYSLGITLMKYKEILSESMTLILSTEH